ncbi:hypothetical protein BKA67DRAFT_534786 [Truncatella angustata]|uniref:Aminoglycoside phosphotransferase domain-containing protein n=1 Tax=Truncatella angustata TaxID=152316 RepID=A0A9P8ZYC0_9PEZI|nr:uncharacterized protein BKA67DRAFT_534786 [Truncatella angustata]KAH6655881.1 hypothetical protein BKA67DRAFT_534786 [Truncatella angustata]
MDSCIAHHHMIFPLPCVTKHTLQSDVREEQPAIRNKASNNVREESNIATNEIWYGLREHWLPKAVTLCLDLGHKITGHSVSSSWMKEQILSFSPSTSMIHCMTDTFFEYQNLKKTCLAPLPSFRHLPGHPLKRVVDGLSHTQKLKLARELGLLHLRIETNINDIAGRLEVHHGIYLPGINVAGGVFTQPFGTELREYEDSCIDWSHTNNERLPLARLRHDPPGLTVNEIMLAIYQRRIHQALNRNPALGNLVKRFYDPCQRLVQDMVDIGLFKPQNDVVCLHHPDLFSRNIMVDITSNDDIFITGVLDWNDAIFAPRFVGRVLPGWLWQHAPASKFSKANEDHDEPVQEEAHAIEETYDRGDNINVLVNGVRAPVHCHDESVSEEDGQSPTRHQLEDSSNESDDSDSNTSYTESDDLENEPLDVSDNEAFTSEAEEIRQAFIDTVGEEWMQEATDKRFPLARRLLHFSSTTAF